LVPFPIMVWDAELTVNAVFLRRGAYRLTIMFGVVVIAQALMDAESVTRL